MCIWVGRPMAQMISGYSQASRIGYYPNWTYLQYSSPAMPRKHRNSAKRFGA